MDKSSALEYIDQMFHTGTPADAARLLALLRQYTRFKLSLLRVSASFVFMRVGRGVSVGGGAAEMQKVQSEIRRVDANILAAVRQQLRTYAVPCFILRNAVVHDAITLCIKTGSYGQTDGIMFLPSSIFKSWPQNVSIRKQLQVVNQLCSHFEAYRDYVQVLQGTQQMNFVLLSLMEAPNLEQYFGSGTASMIIAKDRLNPLVSQKQVAKLGKWQHLFVIFK